MSKKSLGTLTLDLVAKTGSFEQGMDRAARNTDRRMKSIKKSGQTAARAIGAAFAAIGGAIGARAVIDATVRQENALRQLEARLKSTEGAAGLSSQELQNLASSMQQLTTFGDEAVMEMEGLLLTFTNIQGEVFKRATPAILDMSVAMGTDLRSSAVQLGKALNDPVLGLTAMSRAGIQFTDAQKETIKALVEGGRTAEAQGLILKELEKQFGGAAAAAADTFGGALQQTKNAFGDLLEAPGGLKDGKEALQGLTTFLQDDNTKQAFADLTTAFIKLSAAAASAVVGIVDYGKGLGEFIGRVVHGEPEILKLERSLSQLKSTLDSGVISDGKLLTGIRLATGEFIHQGTAVDQLQEKITALQERLADIGFGIPAEAAVEEGDTKKPPAPDPPIDPEAFAKKAEAEAKAAEAKTKADEAAAKAEAEAAEKRQRIQENYQSLVRSLRTDEEALTEALRESLAVVDAIGDITDTQRSATLGRIADDATAEAPDMTGLLGGADSSADIDTARTELENWHSEQLQLLDKFRSERADLNATWDAEELALRQQYEEQLTEITQASEDQRRQQQQEGYSTLFDVASQYYQGMESEEAGYMRSALALGQTLMDDKKRKALNSILANTSDAAMGAYSSMASIPYVGPVLGAAAAGAVYVAGGLAAAKLTGMAHDGIDSVPQDGTWLLQKGERVTTAETSAKLDNTLARLQQSLQPAANPGPVGAKVTQNITVAGRPDNSTASQLARESARKQRLTQRRLGA